MRRTQRHAGLRLLRQETGAARTVPPAPVAAGGLTDGATASVQDLADSLIKKIEGLVAPRHGWAPEKADSGFYEPFLWLGQHLAVAIFTCVVVVCALTAWQGVPRLKQMGRVDWVDPGGRRWHGVGPGDRDAAEPGRERGVHGRVQQRRGDPVRRHQ